MTQSERDTRLKLEKEVKAKEVWRKGDHERQGSRMLTKSGEN